MKNTNQQSPNSEHNKDSQYQRVFEALQHKPATRKELSVLLNIDRANICGYIATLRKFDRVWTVRIRMCRITKHIAEELTCNPELKPDDNQLKLFS